MVDSSPSVYLTDEAHLSGPVFRELERISQVYSCGLSQLVSAFMLDQLSRIPSYSGVAQRIPKIVGPEFEKCRHALSEERLAFAQSIVPPQSPAGSTATPLEPLASAWREVAGESFAETYLRRLSSQICSKYGTQSVRTPVLACSMFKNLFPTASFFTFANDAHRFSQTMDSASMVWERISPSPSAGLLEKWAETWACAKESYPGQYVADDPYLFVPAVSPKFSLPDFKRLAGNVDLRDALALAASPVVKRPPPSPGALTGVGELS